MTDFSAVEDLGELHPDYLSGLLHDEETRIEIHHGDRLLNTIEDPSSLQVSSAKMVDMSRKKKVKFRVNLIVGKKIPGDVEERIDDTTTDEEDNDGDNSEDTADENGNDDSDFNDGKMTFSMTDGPSE